MSGLALAIPGDVERRGFIGPIDLVEVEKLRELTFAVMGEADVFVRERWLLGAG